METETKELSLEELDDVAGGTICTGGERNWFTQGCAATVETGSDCWHTDGGCTKSNIEYSNLPNCKCKRCGADAHRFHTGADILDRTSTYRCRSCGEYRC